jgi:hypothetical protein
MQVGPFNLRLSHRLGHYRFHRLNMSTRRQLGHHAAISSMHIVLRVQHTRQQAALTTHHGGRRFVTGRFET